MELLVKRVQKGNEEVFIKVIDEYMPQMYINKSIKPA